MIKKVTQPQQKTSFTTTSSIFVVVGLIAILCSTIIVYPTSAVFKPGDTDDELPATPVQSDNSSSENTTHTPDNNSVSPSPTSTPAITTQSNDKNGSTSNGEKSGVSTSKPDEKESFDWTPWLIGGSSALTLAVVGALVWRKSRK